MSGCECKRDSARHEAKSAAGKRMKILVVHEVNYLAKIIYEFQIVPETLAMQGHDVTVIDYDDSWSARPRQKGAGLRTEVHEGVHRAYPQARVTVRRPGLI